MDPFQTNKIVNIHLGSWSTNPRLFLNDRSLHLVTLINIWHIWEDGSHYPSVTLTRSFFTTWVGIPRGFLWTRNCVVTFGLAIAGFYLKNLSLWTFALELGMLWRPRPCFAASPWTALYSWFYIPGSIFLVLYSWLCIPGFIFQVSDYWFYIPGFIFQDWECFGGLGLASRPRLGLLYIPGFIFLVLYSWFYIPGFVFLAFRFQISDSRIQIADFRCQISDSRLQISDFRFQFSDSRFQISYFRFQIADFRIKISDFRLQISDFRIQISDFRFQVSDFRFQIWDFRFVISDFRFEVSDLRFQN